MRTLATGLDQIHLSKSAVFPLSQVARRILYVAALIHIEHPTIQLIVLLSLSLLTMLVLIKTKPFECQDSMALQLFNEICVLLSTGFMFGFTEMNWRENDAKMAKLITGLLIAVMIIMLTVNLLLIAHSSVFGALHAHRVRSSREEQRKQGLVKTKTIDFEINSASASIDYADKDSGSSSVEEDV